MSGQAASVIKMPRSRGDMEVITLTPEMATELLEHNTLNRPLKDVHVQRIARQIIEGKWKFNGDTIKVADTGDVLDGQHRLWAVIEAKRPVETILVRGIERDAFATIDTLRSMRSGGDVLALNGAGRYRNQMASALQWLIRWQRGVLPNYRDPKNRVENSDIEAAYAAHPAMVNAVEAAVRLRGVANPSILGFFYYVLNNRDAALAGRMMETLRNPVSVAMTDPFFQLRAYFLADRPERKDPLMSIALCIKAANAAHRGQKVSLLKWQNQGQRAEAFPVLDDMAQAKRGAA